MSYIAEIFHVFLWIFLAGASEKYYISESRVTWNEAVSSTSNCNIAVPDFEMNSTKTVVNTGDLDQVINLDDIWVGYVQRLTPFEYIDCVAKPNRHPNYSVRLNAVGQCHTACKYSEIGIRGTECYCLTKERQSNSDIPYDPNAFKPSQMSCGGEDSISVFRANLAVYMNIIQGGNGNCLQFEHYGDRSLLNWLKCGGYTPALCISDEPTTRNVSRTAGVPWKDAVNKCFEANLKPVVYNDLKDVQERVNPSWLGIIRSTVINPYTAFNDSDGGPAFWYGYLSNDRVLHFTKDQGTSKYMLCKKKTSSTIKTSAAFTTTSKSDSSVSGASAEITSSSSPETVTSWTNISTGTESAANDEQKVDSEGPDVGAIIGASVVSVLIVIVAVVVIIVLKRRKKLPLICKGTSPPNESGYQQSKSTIDQMSHGNHVYDHASVDHIDINSANINANNTYAHTYFVLEPHVNESNTDDTTYDTSGNDNKTVTETDNVYNKLELDSNKTYDHAHINIRNGIRKPDDTYDTTQKAAMKLKARPSKGSDTFGDTGEDEYSHITKKQVNNIRTDNVYGVPNNLENDYGDVGTSNKNNPNDEGDTYSHINNKH